MNYARGSVVGPIIFTFLMLGIVISSIVAENSNFGGNPEKIPQTASGGVIINNNDDLINYCAGRPGDGSPGNPFIIEDMYYTFTTVLDNFLLSMTNLYVIIQDCTFTSTVRPYDLLVMQMGCSNVVVQRCVFRNSQRAIRIIDANNITIRGNTITENVYYPIYMSGGTPGIGNVFNCAIDGNTLSGTYSGITMSLHCYKNLIINNDILNNGDHGILLEFPSDTNGGPHENNITRNTIHGNSDNGIYCNSYSTTYGYNNTVYNNIIYSNGGYGICLSANTWNTSTWYNDIHGNTLGQAIDSGNNNHWNDSSNGNYWGDFLARYPSTSTDGIHYDTPYEIQPSSSIYDMLPLVNAPIINHAPYVTSVYVGADGGPYTNANLTLSYIFHDTDGQSECTPQVKWYLDDVWQPQFDNQLTLSHVWTNKSQWWKYTMRPFDGIDYGAWTNSSSFYIQNCGGIVTNIQVLPMPAKDFQNLNLVNFNCYDPDEGETIQQYEVEWVKNGNSWYGGNYSILSGFQTTVGDRWQAAIHTYDGITWGSWYFSAEVLIVSDATIIAGEPIITAPTDVDIWFAINVTAHVTWVVHDNDTNLKDYSIIDKWSQPVVSGTFSDPGDATIVVLLQGRIFTTGTYYYDLYAYDQDLHCSIWRITVHVFEYTPPPTPPSPPAILTSNQTISNGSLGITWTTVVGATSYKVFINGMLNSTTIASQLLIEFGNYGEYLVYVVACNTGGDSPASNDILIVATLPSSNSGDDGKNDDPGNGPAPMDLWWIFPVVGIAAASVLTIVWRKKIRVHREMKYLF